MMRVLKFAVPALSLLAACSPGARAQQSGASPDAGAQAAMSQEMMTGMHAGDVAMLHMHMSPARPATHDDSTRALALVHELRDAIAPYRDTTAAVRDGYRMFLPNVKQQRVFHFTNWRYAVGEALRFDPAKPTSLLYERDASGGLRLIGAMYTMPRRASLEQLDARVPLGIAQWHQHVNWCLPRRGEGKRWAERRDGQPVFGPESPIATKEACDAVGGDFHPALLGWMVHVNVFAGDDLATIFRDEHGGTGHAAHGATQGMSGDMHHDH